MNYHSEYAEDRWIADNLPLPPNGVYVDVGCAHPVNNSNTAFLRERGWTGLAIDGNPSWGQYWTTPFRAAVIGSSLTPVGFQINSNPALSRFSDGATAVQPVTLESLLNEANIERINLLTIDVEGAEFDVLSTMDLDRHRPDIIVAEYATLGLDHISVAKDYRVLVRLCDAGWTLVFSTVANFVFHRRP